MTKSAGAQLPSTPSPTIAEWPTCPQIQYQDGQFVFGDHATHHNPGDTHGIIGNILPDGTSLPNRNLYGVDDVYTVPNSNDTQFVQCFCALGDLDVPDGYGIQTLWRTAESCTEASGNEICADYGCNWNIPYYDGGTSCLPAIALHSNYYACVPQCGNGTLDVNEQCDDGNRIDGDGCSASCQFEREICNNQLDDNGNDLVDCFDPQCECTPPFEDPSSVAFDAGSGGLDRLKASGFSPLPTFNPETDKFCAILATPGGKIWSDCLSPGAFTTKGRTLKYKSKAAKTTGGFAKITLVMYTTRMKFSIQAYGDMTGACPPGVMGLQTTLGDDNVFFELPWTPTPQGCKAHFVHELL